METLSKNEIAILYSLAGESEERIRCLESLVQHEHASQLKLRSILAKHCQHSYKDESSFSLDNNAYSWRCKECGLLKTVVEELTKADTDS